MNIKELAEFTGKTVRTIRSWIKKAELKGCEEIAQGYAIDYTIDEVEKILKAGSMSKDAVTILMFNARESQKNATSKTVATVDNPMEEMTKMISIAVATAMVPVMQQVVETMKGFGNVETKPLQLSLPSAPDVKPRALLRQLVNDYASSINISHREAWNELYKQFYYRCNESIKTKAKNLNIIPLDYLEQENKLLTACSIMKELIQ